MMALERIYSLHHKETKGQSEYMAINEEMD